MKPTSYDPTEPHLWLVGNTPPRTLVNCRKTSESKARTYSYDDLIDLLIQLAMERENNSHIDKYFHKHLQRETHAERKPGEGLSHCYSKSRKGGGGQLKRMHETAPSNDKGVPNLFYVRPKDKKRGPSHAPEWDWRSACMLQLQRKQKTKDGEEVNHQDSLRTW